MSASEQTSSSCLLSSLSRISIIVTCSAKGRYSIECSAQDAGKSEACKELTPPPITKPSLGKKRQVCPVDGSVLFAIVTVR